jgi:SAM-dependent methyltransferase
MNEDHNELCSSPAWAEHLTTDVLPKVIDGVQLGRHLLEAGPGFGLATDILRLRVERVTAVEIDPEYAARLSARFAGTNVEIVEGDATALRFRDGSFSSAASFTMLHHVPTAALQDRLFAEVARALTPGGVLVGSDSVDSESLRAFHEGDTYNPVDPATLPRRLEAAGFVDVRVTVEDLPLDEPDADPNRTVLFVAYAA